MFKFFILSFLCLAHTAILLADTKPVTLTLTPGIGGYFFRYDDEVDAENTRGRQRMLDYKYEPVITGNLKAELDIYGVKLIGNYGGNGLSFNQNENNNENLPAHTPKWAGKSKNTLYNLSLDIMGFRFSRSHYKFNVGRVDLLDVSEDYNGNEGPAIASYNNNIELKDTEVTFPIGDVVTSLLGVDTQGEKNGYLKYGVYPLTINYIFNESSLPVIPYHFKRINGQLYFAEGEIQQMNTTNSVLGIGWDWKYISARGYWGKATVDFVDEDNIRKKITSNVNLWKVDAHYEWVIRDTNVSYVIRPSASLSYYNYNELDRKDYYSFGGVFYVYQVGLELGIRI